MKYLIMLFLLTGCDSTILYCKKLNPSYGKLYEITDGFYKGTRGRAIKYLPLTDQIKLNINDELDEVNVSCEILKEIK